MNQNGVKANICTKKINLMGKQRSRMWSKQRRNAPLDGSKNMKNDELLLLDTNVANASNRIVECRRQSAGNVGNTSVEEILLPKSNCYSQQSSETFHLLKELMMPSVQLNYSDTTASLTTPVGIELLDTSLSDAPIFMSALESCTKNGGPTHKFTDTIALAANVPYCRPVSSFFSDGTRRIDFVLVYELNVSDSEQKQYDTALSAGDRNDSPQKHSEKRRIFESNLQKHGLELEYAVAMHSNTQFVLIHAPFNVLLKQAEVMNIKMPVHQNDIKKHASIMDGAVNAFLRRFRFLDFDESVKRRIEPIDYFTQPFIEQHLECFVNHDKPEIFFSNSDRTRMVYDFLIRTRYESGQKEKFRFGIDRLVQAQTYTAAYPLHDDINYSKHHVEYETCTDRELLYETWVRPKNIWKYQPLHLIKEYFGTKIGFYFAWLGYYTRSLYVVSILGIISVLYGLFTMKDDIPSSDVCGDDGIGAKVLLCPVCEKFCNYTRLSNSCRYSKITYVFDNGATVFFAILMSVWTTLFLEGWKRYHSELAYKWNVLDFETEQEVMRPEFQYLKGIYRKNPVTQQKEPYIPFRTRALRFTASFVVVLFFMLLVVGLVSGIVVYRIILMHVFYAIDGEDKNIFRAQAIISGTAAVINLIFILIMNYIYDILALKLTELECHRTQTEFDNSYILKVYLFQFVNFYSSLFYIAFIKGRFSGVPAYILTDAESAGVRVFGQRLEDCDPAGCMVELVIQLCIIMIGKQIFNAFAEIGYPVIDHWIRRWRLRLPSERCKHIHSVQLERLEAKGHFSRDGSTPLYERDYSLSPVWQQFLFNEYLEMVLQFGFVTLFVAAFPLAPFFALLNNILEIRLDAYKFIVTTRRPIPAQAKNIGVWVTILDLLSNVAVLCNAFVIAFTSDFIPKLYYRLTHNGELYGFVNDSLSHFDARDIMVHDSDFANVTECRYRDYRKPPCELGLRDSHNECSTDGRYEFQDKWWIILSMRLIFVLLFQLFVLSIKAIFAYVIPDVPSEITMQLHREKYLMRQAILQRSDATMNSSRYNSPKSDFTTNKDLRLNTDIDEVAFQPDEDLVGDDNVDNVERRNDVNSDRHQQRDNLQRMFLNRRRPSLSPHTPRRVAAEGKRFSTDEESQFASIASLSPMWEVQNRSTNLKNDNADSVPSVLSERNLESSQFRQLINGATPIESSNDSFCTAIDKNIISKNYEQ